VQHRTRTLEQVHSVARLKAEHVESTICPRHLRTVVDTFDAHSALARVHVVLGAGCESELVTGGGGQELVENVEVALVGLLEGDA